MDSSNLFSGHWRRLW